MLVLSFGFWIWFWHFEPVHVLPKLMPRFTYLVREGSAAVHKTVAAENREAALERLREQGIRPLTLEPLDKEKREGFALPFFERRLGRTEQTMFIRDLGIMLSSGTELMTALEAIAKEAAHPRIRRIAYAIAEAVLRGETLSGAFHRWGEDFTPVFLSLLKAGETAGNLPETLLSYAKELRKEHAFVRKLHGALIYPLILISALIGMNILILTVIAPRFKEVFASTNAPPPLFTRIFFRASDIWLANTSVIIGIAIAVAVGITLLLRKRNVRFFLGTCIARLPVIRRLYRNLALMRFCKTLSTLIDAGFSLKQALLVSAEIMDPAYQAYIALAARRLGEGVNFAASLGENRLFFPQMLVSVIATGEKSGELGLVLRHMAEFYEEETEYALEVLLTFVEPVLLLIVGVIVGLLAGSLIAPIYRLIGRF